MACHASAKPHLLTLVSRLVSSQFRKRVRLIWRADTGLDSSLIILKGFTDIEYCYVLPSAAKNEEGQPDDGVIQYYDQGTVSCKFL